MRISKRILVLAIAGVMALAVGGLLGGGHLGHASAHTMDPVQVQYSTSLPATLTVSTIALLPDHQADTTVSAGTGTVISIDVTSPAPAIVPHGGLLHFAATEINGTNSQLPVTSAITPASSITIQQLPTATITRGTTGHVPPVLQATAAMPNFTIATTIRPPHESVALGKIVTATSTSATYPFSYLLVSPVARGAPISTTVSTPVNTNGTLAIDTQTGPGTVHNRLPYLDTGQAVLAGSTWTARSSMGTGGLIGGLTDWPAISGLGIILIGGVLLWYRRDRGLIWSSGIWTLVHDLYRRTTGAIGQQRRSYEPSTA